MQYIQLGKSDLKVSRITGGAWAIGANDDSCLHPDNAIKALRIAFELGITTIDTAPTYGLGFSEEVVGEAIKDLPREKLQLITKCGMLWDEAKGGLYVKDKFNGRIVALHKYAGKESIIAQCEKSLKRLNTDYIDLYMIHWPDVTTPIEESMEAMNLLIEQGKIRAVGLCNHSADLIARASAVCPIAAVKDRYSMLYREIENEMVPHCVENNIGIMCYSVLQRGLLENTLLDGREVRFTAWPRGDNRKELALFDPENIKLITTFLHSLNAIGKDYGATVAQLAIRWLLDQPGISVALLTAKDRQQLEHDARVLDLNLSIGDKIAVSHLLQELEENLAFANLCPPLEDKIAKFCTI